METHWEVEVNSKQFDALTRFRSTFQDPCLTFPDWHNPGGDFSVLIGILFVFIGTFTYINELIMTLIVFFGAIV